MQAFVTVLVAGTKVWPRTPATGVYKEYHKYKRKKDFKETEWREYTETESLYASPAQNST